MIKVSLIFYLNFLIGTLLHHVRGFVARLCKYPHKRMCKGRHFCVISRRWVPANPATVQRLPLSVRGVRLKHILRLKDRLAYSDTFRHIHSASAFYYSSHFEYSNLKIRSKESEVKSENSFHNPISLETF